MSWAHYRANDRALAPAGAPGFIDSLQQWRADSLPPGTPDDDVFTGLRDSDPGRGVDWPA